MSILLIETRHKSGHGVWGGGPGQREQGCAMREEENLTVHQRAHPERKEEKGKGRDHERTTTTIAAAAVNNTIGTLRVAREPNTRRCSRAVLSVFGSHPPSPV